MINEKLRVLIFFIGCIIISLVILPIDLGVASTVILVLLYSYLNELL